MNIYQQKSRFKLVLLVMAMVIAIATLWYTNVLARKIAKEEKQQVELWADAIKRRAKLVKFTNELFDELSADQRNKVKLWADATRLVGNDDVGGDALTFLTDILTRNNDIPVILTDGEGYIFNSRNVDFPGLEDSTHLAGDLEIAFTQYEPIVITFLNERSYIYYADSRLFEELKVTLNDLIESFISEVVINSASLPVILTDQMGNITNYGNIDSLTYSDTELMAKKLKSMGNQNDPIEINLGDGQTSLVYYENSYLLQQLKVFPYIQLGIMALFLVVAYFIFSTARRAEENQVWVGMSKETAHQLGTPISSLSAWTEYMRETSPDEWAATNVADEIEKDVNRLALVAERFSKIGSKPQLVEHKVADVLGAELDYFRKRNKSTDFSLQIDEPDMAFKINRELFDWVIENLLKNALDAMDGKGSIKMEASKLGGKVVIDVSDTGKGIPSSNWRTIFQPGFSTKRRGWGLGLSLTKRIIREYHRGKIYVKSSEIGKGTTFRIIIAAA